MRRIGCFFRDERGTSFEGIALSVSIIAVAFVASADMLDYVAKSHEQMASAPARHSMTAMSHGNLDETPTASLPQLVSRSVLDPCTGRTK